MKNLIFRLLITLLLSGIIFTQPGKAIKPDQEKYNAAGITGITKLLSRLDLNLKGLAKVKASAGDSMRAAAELLSYYRERNFVRHPVDRKSKADAIGKSATVEELKTADNALKHIFIGQSAYPPYFCGDDINWGTRPVPDNEWVWQLNRMSFWGSMALAYWHTGDEKYAREWCRQLVDWTNKNPRDAEHNYSWRSIEAGIRGHSWMELYQRFLDSPSFTPEVLVAFLNSCYDHAGYLMTKYSKGSNWALMEAEGLAFIAIMFPEFKDSEIWRDEGIMRLNKEVTTQVYPDGHQRELAMGYHMGCIRWFTNTYDLAKMNALEGAFPVTYSKIIEKMCEVPMKLGLPDGSTAQFGDSWTGKPGDLWEPLGEWAKLYHRDDFLYLATEGREGKMPDATAYALDKSGLYSMRSSWNKDAICLVLKCGPDGGGHCQPDNGTFELYAGGRHLMPDAGSYIYSGDPVNRAWFRQTKVHQTVTLNSKNSAYAPKLLLWKPGKDIDILVVENDSYPDLSHRRAVLFVDKRFFVIIDDLTGTGSGDVDLHFQLGPGKAVFNYDELSVRSDFPEGWNVLVRSMKQVDLKLSEEEGQVSFVYTKKEPRPAFSYNLKKEISLKGVRFITIVAPYKDALPDISAILTDPAEPGASHISLDISVDKITRKINYDLPVK